MSVIYSCNDIRLWDQPSPNLDITQQLEAGRVVVFPHLAFDHHLDPALLTPALLAPKSKNVSYDIRTDQVKGCQGQEAALRELMARYARTTTALIERCCPQYQGKLMPGKTSYRPARVEGRKTSYRKDDSLLHVDSFPSMPVQGQRILRFFTNVNPQGETRDWRVGKSIEDALDRCLPGIRPPFALAAPIMDTLGITKSRRSDYDYYMLQLHNAMKADAQFQQETPQEAFNFPAQSSWMVFTDQVPHAAMGGQYLLEQTFYLQVEDMRDPSTSPLHRLAARVPRVRNMLGTAQ